MNGNGPRDDQTARTGKRNDWIWFPADLGGIWFFVIFSIVTTEVFSFFSRLAGTYWIWCYGIALVIAALGVSLIFFAKIPLYRQRRFFTFGSQALPAERRAFYRFGYGCVGFAIALLLCLFI